VDPQPGVDLGHAAIGGTDTSNDAGGGLGVLQALRRTV